MVIDWAVAISHPNVSTEAILCGPHVSPMSIHHYLVLTETIMSRPKICWYTVFGNLVRGRQAYRSAESAGITKRIQERANDCGQVWTGVKRRPPRLSGLSLVGLLIGWCTRSAPVSWPCPCVQCTALKTVSIMCPAGPASPTRSPLCIRGQ